MGQESVAAARGPASAGPRLTSLDAYRGFTMLAMASGGLGMQQLLTDPTWGWLADQLEHRRWEGCTFWDLIQPSFMFIVGVAMPLAFAQRRQRGDSWARQCLHAARRSLTLIALGIFLDSFGRNAVVIQFIRVLQQIAIGYFLAFLVLDRGPKVQAGVAALLLVGHTAAYLLWGETGTCRLLPAAVAAAVGGPANGPPTTAIVPLFPPLAAGGPWGPITNVGFWVDQLLGLPLSSGHYVTINAISSTATILFGVLAGELLQTTWPARRKLGVLAAAGLAGLVVGLALTPWVPMVKRLWTASFTLFAGGWTCWFLVFFYGVIDVLSWRRWAFPLVVVGVNSIAIYVAAGTLRGPIRSALQPFVAGPIAAAIAPPWQPVVMSVLSTTVLWLGCYWLYRRGIFFKV
ncbi:MAG: heparan-alpha-glucosaminide N-acetyltransferase domain-containing protein [Gemmataceae bacterium]|nr:heparan-alpha-glucosaminide N-acetyltransferase domain-containing protein [Gemmataceae bacterium]MDW8264821.1 heparan-alpha-glucosaminide N-acetyltransferase domain-containing protein [Gemmataceae bacterium]